MNDRSRFEQDLRDRQRNIVYPDTLRNETRGYRELLNRTAKLTRVQVIAFAILGPAYMLFGLAMVAAALFVPRFARETANSILLAVLVGVPGCVVVAGTGVVLIALGWKMLRRSLSNQSSRSPN